ncbi:MAG TPA: hypothetical protein ENG47_06945 [Candidatus Aerophobetes bacterium]|uniref:Uncharacterized protein n=1 Tax=Aerophobetes bacterium TaxID=2030807 RepID=A0A7V0QR80_UNCAE|nr:hypothetical protein [Candidatus Aerophobetes bacterium]
MFIDWQIVVLVIAVIMAGAALILSLGNRKNTRDSLNEIKMFLEEKIGKIKEASLQAQQRINNADSLIQKQHNDLLQHLISLTKTGESKKREDQNMVLKYLLESRAADQISQIIAQKVLDEIKKKW